MAGDLVAGLPGFLIGLMIGLVYWLVLERRLAQVVEKVKQDHGP